MLADTQGGRSISVLKAKLLTFRVRQAVLVLLTEGSRHVTNPGSRKGGAGCVLQL